VVVRSCKEALFRVVGDCFVVYFRVEQVTESSFCRVEGGAPGISTVLGWNMKRLKPPGFPRFCSCETKPEERNLWNPPWEKVPSQSLDSFTTCWSALLAEVSLDN
jgi:hypothetical protein